MSPYTQVSDRAFVRVLREDEIAIMAQIKDLRATGCKITDEAAARIEQLFKARNRELDARTKVMLIASKLQSQLSELRAERDEFARQLGAPPFVPRVGK